MKGMYTKLVVILLIGGNVWFTDRVLDLLAQGGQEPVALIAAWFAFTTGEISILGLIKKAKVTQNG